jgi:alkylation response protein AidB-like acyl-CoA dehydrogenase
MRVERERPSIPAGIDYIARARDLAPVLAAAATEIEAGRQLTDTVLAALIDAGLYRLLMPRTFGGAEVDPMTFVQVMEAISKADASTGWCLCQASGCSMSAAYLEPAVAQEIFGDRRAVLAWGPGPKARAIAVDGGYRVTGTWMFASGGRHATWLGGHCPIYATDGTLKRYADGSPVERTMLFPASSARMIDVWHVIGLRGTGSDSFAVEDLFVPEDHAVIRDFEVERREPGRLYRFSSSSMYAAGFGGVALGIARSTLDEFIRLARDKTPRGVKDTLRDNGVVQSQVGQAEAKIRSARLLLLTSLEEIWQELAGTDRVTLEQRMKIRLAATYAIHQAKEVVDTAYHAAGATAIFNNNPFERRFRDIRTVAQQLQGRQSHFETVGQHLLGLETDNSFL